MTKICIYCKKEFSKPVKESITQWEARKCCSQSCGSKSRECQVAGWNKGKKLSPEHLENIKKGLRGNKNALGHTGMKADKNHKWKGDDVGYFGLHNWVRYHLGTPKLCEHCGKTEGRFHWANIDHKYKRNLIDWIRLCVSCHKKYDKEHNFK